MEDWGTFSVGIVFRYIAPLTSNKTKCNVYEMSQEDRQGRVLVETPSIPFDDSNFR